MKKRNDPVVLLSNLLLIAAVVLVVLWPVTGKGVFGILAGAALLLSGAFGGMNASRRGQRTKARLQDHDGHDHHGHDHGEHA